MKTNKHPNINTFYKCFIRKMAMKSVVFLRIVTVVLVVFSAPLFAVDVFEGFENGQGGGFWENEQFFVHNDGYYVFRGNGTNTTSFAAWNGGSNPGGWAPEPNNSNYFKDFNVSVDAVWLGGANDSGYGLLVCIQKDRFGYPDNIRFAIDGAGESWYTISRPNSEGVEILIDWTRSSFITPNASNHLSIAKLGNEFRFYINYTEVERLVIDGYVGGGIAVEASNLLDAAFDNFSIESLDSSPPPANVPPTAAFSVSTTDGEAPLTVTLDASSSTDSDGTIVEYNWSASDGQTASSRRVNMTFSNAGTYTISLVVTDNNGLQSTNTAKKAVTVTAKPVAPVAKLTVSPTNGDAPLTVSLNGNGSSDSDGRIVDYAWTASNGQQAAGKNSQITFDHAGNYTITLTVTDNDGLTDTAQGSVTVTPKPVAPVAHLSISPTNGDAPLTVSLNGNGSTDSDGTIIDYAWTASNGQQAAGKNSQITFDHAGNYTITLTVTDNDGLTDTAQGSVTVSEPIVTPPSTEEPGESETESDVAHLEFIGLNDFYRVGETLVMELVETANRDKYTRVDLWMAVQLPSEAFLFRTDIPMSPWSPQPQAHKTSIENAETSHYIFDFELPEGMGGDYTLYAVYVKEGENPVTNGFSHRSNLVIRQIVLANRKD